MTPDQFAIFHSFETTPLWLCPCCGKVETCGQTWSPSPTCGCQGPGYIICKQLNAPAQALMARIEEYHSAPQKSRAVAEEELRSWPPIADRYDMRLRAP